MAKSKTPADPATGPLVEPGLPAPAFQLSDQHGKIHRLADYRGQWVILYFYPKDDTSGCTKEACQFQDSLPRFRDSRAAILGVSPDGTASHDRFAGKHELTFPLLADENKTTLAAYGVWQEKSMYGRRYMGVVRTTYLIDPKGKVAHRWDKVKVPGHAEDVLGALAALASS